MKLFVIFQVLLAPPFTAFVLVPLGLLYSILLFFWLLLFTVQLLSHVQLFATPWIAAHQAHLSITNSQSLLKPMFIESVISSNHLILYCPLLLLPPIFPSIRVFFNKPALCIRWPKGWSCSIISSNEYSGLISFRIDWFDLLAVQGTLKSLMYIIRTGSCWCTAETTTTL